MTGSLARLRATALCSLLLGLGYWLGGAHRTASETYDAVRFVPIWTWGLALTVYAVPLLWALWTDHKWTILVTSSLAFGWHLAWCVLFLTNSTNPDVALAGPAVFGFLAYLHFSLAQATGVEIAKTGSSKCG